MAEREKQETLSETKELVTILQYEKKKKKKPLLCTYMLQVITKRFKIYYFGDWPN